MRRHSIEPLYQTVERLDCVLYVRAEPADSRPVRRSTPLGLLRASLTPPLAKPSRVEPCGAEQASLRAVEPRLAIAEPWSRGRRASRGSSRLHTARSRLNRRNLAAHHGSSRVEPCRGLSAPCRGLSEPRLHHRSTRVWQSEADRTKFRNDFNPRLGLSYST